MCTRCPLKFNRSKIFLDSYYSGSLRGIILNVAFQGDLFIGFIHGLSQTHKLFTSCVLCQAKVVGKSNYAGSGNLVGYDEYIPMVDKAVDAGWKKQALLQIQRSHSTKG